MIKKINTYNVFTYNKDSIVGIGNPSTVYLCDKNLNLTQMSQLAIIYNTPISCFVKINNNSNIADVDFFAPNGQYENFCGHGLTSIVQALKDNNINHINKFKTKNDIIVHSRIIDNNMCQIEIPINNFDLFKYENQSNINNIINLFSLFRNNVLDIFQAGQLGDILIELDNYNTLQNLIFNEKNVIKFLKEHNLRAIMFFCNNSKFHFANIEIRVFYVNLDTLEDICCGSVNIGVSKILLQKYNITKYKVIQSYKYSLNSEIGGYQEIELDTKNNILILKGFVIPV